MGFLIPVKVSIMPLISGENLSLIEWSLSPLKVESLGSLCYAGPETNILMVSAPNSLHFPRILLNFLV